MAITGVPPQAKVTVEGTTWQPGLVVPAGALDVVVSLPSGQLWKDSIALAPGATASVSLDSLAASVPVRTIKVDGKVDDWVGIEPLWAGVRERGSDYWFVTGLHDPFPGQSGTVLARAYLCRDNSNIYVRMDFDNGTPDLNLTPVIKYNLVREIHCQLPGGKQLIASLQSSRQWGVNSWLGIWDNTTRTSTNLGTLNAYAMGDSSLELAIPLSRFEKYLSSGPVAVQVCVADAGPSDWVNGYSSYNRPVDFLK